MKFCTSLLSHSQRGQCSRKIWPKLLLPSRILPSLSFTSNRLRLQLQLKLSVQLICIPKILENSADLISQKLVTLEQHLKGRGAHNSCRQVDWFPSSVVVPNGDVAAAAQSQEDTQAACGRSSPEQPGRRRLRVSTWKQPWEWESALSTWLLTESEVCQFRLCLYIPFTVEILWKILHD